MTNKNLVHFFIGIHAPKRTTSPPSSSLTSFHPLNLWKYSCTISFIWDLNSEWRHSGLWQTKTKPLCKRRSKGHPRLIRAVTLTPLHVVKSSSVDWPFATVIRSRSRNRRPTEICITCHPQMTAVHTPGGEAGGRQARVGKRRMGAGFADDEWRDSTSASSQCQGSWSVSRPSWGLIRTHRYALSTIWLRSWTSQRWLSVHDEYGEQICLQQRISPTITACLFELANSIWSASEPTLGAGTKNGRKPSARSLFQRTSTPRWVVSIQKHDWIPQSFLLEWQGYPTVETWSGRCATLWRKRRDIWQQHGWFYRRVSASDIYWKGWMKLVSTQHDNRTRVHCVQRVQSLQCWSREVVHSLISLTLGKRERGLSESGIEVLHPMDWFLRPLAAQPYTVIIWIDSVPGPYWRFVPNPCALSAHCPAIPPHDNPGPYQWIYSFYQG